MSKHLPGHSTRLRLYAIQSCVLSEDRLSVYFLVVVVYINVVVSGCNFVLCIKKNTRI